MKTAVALPMNELQAMAGALAGSGMFGFKTPQQALAIMLVAQSQGIPAAQACVDFDLIQGKPAMTARAMLARFQQAGGVINWTEYSDEVCEAEFSHPQCPRPVKIRWTMNDAHKAGLTGKDNWRKYPRQMLSSRVMSEGVDRCYPAASGGFYPPEVVQDFAKEKNITPTSGAEDRVSADRLPVIAEVVEKVHSFLAQDNVADAVITLDDNDFDADERVYAWTKFDSKQRSAMKKEMAKQKAEREAKTLPPADVISAGMKKRLEARIGESGLDRDVVKQHVKVMYGRDHFTDLTKDEYTELDAWLETYAAPQSPPVVGSPSTADDSAVAAPFSEQIKAAATMDELAEVWKAIPKDDREIYLAAKDARKAELAKAE